MTREYFKHKLDYYSKQIVNVEVEKQRIGNLGKQTISSIAPRKALKEVVDEEISCISFAETVNSDGRK